MNKAEAVKKYGHLTVQMAQVFNETHPQERPDFILWLREHIELAAQENDVSWITLMADCSPHSSPKVSDPESFGLGDMIGFFAQAGAKVAIIDEQGFHEVKHG